MNRVSSRGGEASQQHVQQSTDDFLQTVCVQIRAKTAHRQVRRELEGHIQDVIEELTSEGMSPEEAERIAVERMGDPRDIGRQLNQVHKPVIEWGMIGLLAVMLGVGLFFMYVLELRAGINYGNTVMFGNMAVFAAIGCLLAGACWFFDYRKLRDKGWILYGAAVILALFMLQSASPVQGAKLYVRLPFGTVNVMLVAMFLFIIANAGMQSARDWTVRQTVLQIGLRLVIPITLFLAARAHIACFIYVVTVMFQLWTTRKHVYQIIGIASLVALTGWITMMNSFYFKFRLQRDFTDGTNFFYQYFTLPMKQAGWFGNGPIAPEQRLPYLHSEGLFAYMVYSYGWLMGIGVAALVLTFILASARLGSKVREPFGRLIVYSVTVVTAIQFAWSILMTLGWLPFIGIAMPFVSYGGSSLLLHMLAFGLVLSVAKQRRSLQYIGTGKLAS